MNKKLVWIIYILIIWIQIIDTIFTLSGLGLGYKEGNFFPRYLITLGPAYIMLPLMSILGLIVLFFVFKKLANIIENHPENKQLIVIMILFAIILFRVWVIGVWFGHLEDWLFGVPIIQ